MKIKLSLMLVTYSLVLVNFSVAMNLNEASQKKIVYNINQNRYYSTFAGISSKDFNGSGGWQNAQDFRGTFLSHARSNEARWQRKADNTLKDNAHSEKTTKTIKRAFACGLFALPLFQTVGPHYGARTASETVVDCIYLGSIITSLFFGYKTLKSGYRAVNFNSFKEQRLTEAAKATKIRESIEALD